MPVYVDANSCDCCGGLSGKRCEAICPGDLIAIDPQTLKAYCRFPADCWDCWSCVKACLSGAIIPRLSYMIALYGSKASFEIIKNGFRWTFTGAKGDEEVIEVVAE